MNETRVKQFVEVVANFSTEGAVTPISIVWEDGRTFEITNVTEVLPRKYSKCGGIGVRYSCQIGIARSYLYFDGDKWFVEKKIYG